MSKVYNTVLFDLDGTLTDSKLGITKSVQYALKKFSIEITDLNQLEKFIGPPLTQSFKQFFSFTEEEAETAVKYYREYFTVDGIYENEVYRGIPELLKNLHRSNITMAVATSKPTVFAETIIDHFDLSKYFQVITGSNLDNTRTGKKEIIAHTMDQLNCNPENTIMIGDREYDILGAKENSVESIAVLYGYGEIDEINASKPSYIINNVEDLTTMLLNLTSMTNAN